MSTHALLFVTGFFVMIITSIGIDCHNKSKTRNSNLGFLQFSLAVSIFMMIAAAFMLYKSHGGPGTR